MFPIFLHVKSVFLPLAPQPLFMKVECPVCGSLGVLQKRGGSLRIIHYEYNEGKRFFYQHTVTTKMVTEKSKSLVTENIKSSLSQQKRGARSSARIEHRAFNPGVGGSIPPGPATCGEKGFSTLYEIPIIDKDLLTPK